MTEKECLLTGIALSLFAHFCLLGGMGQKEQPETSGKYVAVTLSSSSLSADAGTGTGIVAASSDQLADHEAADRRRAAFLRYLEDIDDCVHAHRLDGGETGLIGVAKYAVTVLADGTFTEPVLLSSSGSAKLDEAAKRAIQAASGKVKRPAIIGTEPIPVLLYVKYQYGLR